MLCALECARCLDAPILRSPRSQGIDKVQGTECYYGWWNKALEYTVVQCFGKKDSPHESLTVIIATGGEVEEICIARERENSKGEKLLHVLIGPNFLPKVIVMLQ